jgi:hypothetical protein
MESLVPARPRWFFCFSAARSKGDELDCESRPRRRKTKKQNRGGCGPPYKQATPAGFLLPAGAVNGLYNVTNPVAGSQHFYRLIK